MNDLDDVDLDPALDARLRATLRAVAAATPVGDGARSYVGPAPLRRRTGPLVAAAAASALLVGVGLLVATRGHGGDGSGAPPAGAGTGPYLVLGGVPAGLHVSSAVDLAAQGVAVVSPELVYRAAGSAPGSPTIVVRWKASDTPSGGERTVVAHGPVLGATFDVGRTIVVVSARGVERDVLQAFVDGLRASGDGTGISASTAPTGFEPVSIDPEHPDAVDTFTVYDDGSAKRSLTITMQPGTLDDRRPDSMFENVGPTAVRGHAAIGSDGVSADGLQEKMNSSIAPAELPVMAQLAWEERPGQVVVLDGDGYTLADLRAAAETLVGLDAVGWRRFVARHPTTVTKAGEAPASTAGVPIKR